MQVNIAPDFSCDAWVLLKAKLNPTGDWGACPREWTQTIRVVETRITRRFLDLAKRLEREAYAGFAILALDCLLIETMQAFRNGENTKNSSESRTAYTAFLTTAPNFRTFFTEQLANDFYTNVRNGLLHDGETRRGWLVKTSTKYTLIDPQPRNFVVVNRRKFHDALVKEFQEYLQSLRDPAETKLRKCLVKAIDDLCTRSKP